MAAGRTKARQTQAGDPERGKLAAAATLATDLRDGMMRLHRRLRQVRPVGELTQTQLSALTSLELSAALTPRELAELERVQPPTMTRIVARLTELGLVQRVPHPTDGRQVILSTTARGREVLAENRRVRDAWLTKQLAALGDADRETLESAAAIMARIARTEPSRADASRADASRAEASRAEASRADASRAHASRAHASRADASQSPSTAGASPATELSPNTEATAH